VGPVEQHLVSKGFPDAKEISLLVHFDRVISERITRAIIRAGRRRETNRNCDNRYKCCGLHIQNALVSTRQARTTGRKPRGTQSLDSRYYSKAPITQGANRVSAPTATQQEAFAPN